MNDASQDQRVVGSGSDDSLARQRRIDEIADEFERQWRDKDQGQIVEEFLNLLEISEQSDALSELVKQEIDLRNADGEKVDRHEYMERFPDIEEVIDRAFERVEEVDVFVATHTGEDDTSVPDCLVLSVEGRTDVPDQLGRFAIQQRIGSGGFGVVFRATDTKSGETVALKFPRRRTIGSDEELARFINESEHASQLRHDGIVPTYGAEHVDDYVFIVQKFIDGTNLKDWLRSESIDLRRGILLLAQIAEAAAYAHQHGYIHRDLKPANILIDDAGNPFIADFGLVLHADEQFAARGQRCGAPAYMSPEQVQGLAHRMDGRSDIWSLGVILYELLTRRRPFRGQTRKDLFEEIKYRDAWPPRMIDPEIDHQLQTICLRCLTKSSGERYLTADELAKDLREWLDEPPAPPPLAPIVPKGLRSYTADDADFFIQLLPGPRDKNGLPDSIRFWKSRIESTDTQLTFPIGVIFGPSGCGKSSFVKAGLLPKLSTGSATHLYIESTTNDTEVRLLKGLRQVFPAMPDDIDLPDALAALRTRSWISRDKKVLIVLDQFEQWLYSADTYQQSQLTEALRHCDGVNLQCILMVRDDFWVATSRFMSALEVDVREGINARRVDRFEVDHARKILVEFGKAYGKLPKDLSQLTKEQHAFLDKVIQDLSEENRVISMRLALFAEMFKNRPWTRKALDSVGGVSGIGEKFLEETFSATNAPPQYRQHDLAAQALLHELLPETGRHIRGHLRSREELLSASTYVSKPEKFESLIYLLDTDLRLITPSDPDTGEIRQESDSQSDSINLRYFQLTHDYLVPTIRSWLNSSKSVTWQGRAEIRLAELAERYARDKDTKFLPSLGEYVLIQSGVSIKKRTNSQRELMRKASIVHGIRTGIILAVALLIYGGFAFAANENRKAAALAAMNKYLDSPSHLAGRELESINEHQAYLKDPLLAAFSSEDINRRLRSGVALVHLYDQAAERIPSIIEDYVNLPEAAFDRFEFQNIIRAFKDFSEPASKQLDSEFRNNADALEIRVRLALASLVIGELSPFQQLLANIEYPTATTLLTHLIPVLWPDAEELANIAERCTIDLPENNRSATNSVIFFLIVAAAEVGEQQVTDSAREKWQELVAIQYAENPDSGIHAACRYLAHKWELTLPPIAVSRDPPIDRDWWHVEVVPGIEMTFVRISAGTFIRGENSPQNQFLQHYFPREKVNIANEFWIAELETPFEVFDAWLKAKSPDASDVSTFRNKLNLKIRDRLLQSERTKQFFNRHKQTVPVFAITFQEVEGAITWLNDNSNGKRADFLFGLPSSDQWEFACRAGSRTFFHFGDFSVKNYLSQYAAIKTRFDYWTDETKYLEIGCTRIPTRNGLFHTGGNVAEFTRKTDREHQIDPTERCFVKGGTFERAMNCSPGFTDSTGVDVNFDFYGFRLILFDAGHYKTKSVIGNNDTGQELALVATTAAEQPTPAPK